MTGFSPPERFSHRALNVPRPRKPEEIGERSVEGLHTFLQYWSASQNYMFLTGDTEPFMDLPGQERFNHMTNMYRDILPLQHRLACVEE